MKVKMSSFLCLLVTVLAGFLATGASSNSVRTIERDAYTYEGGVSDGKFDGYGVCRYRNGNTYYGYWDRDF